MSVMCKIDWANIIIAGAAVAAFIFSLITYRNNNKFIRKQQFETTFFNMMKQLEDIVSKLSLEVIRESVERKRSVKGFEMLERISKSELVTISGRDVFEHFYNRSKIYIFNQDLFSIVKNSKDEDLELYEDIKAQLSKDYYDGYLEAYGVKSVINNLGITGYEEIDNIHLLDHYFRYLYRIMKFVDETEYLDEDKNYIDERYKYMGILRATLSPYELVFLFYNDLSKYGNEKVKPLIEKYSMFKSLRKELLSNYTGEYFSIKSNNKKYNDYDKFIEKSSRKDEPTRDFIYKASTISKEDNKYLKDK